MISIIALNRADIVFAHFGNFRSSGFVIGRGSRKGKDRDHDIDSTAGLCTGRKSFEERKRYVVQTLFIIEVLTGDPSMDVNDKSTSLLPLNVVSARRAHHRR